MEWAVILDCICQDIRNQLLVKNIVGYNSYVVWKLSLKRE